MNTVPQSLALAPQVKLEADVRPEAIYINCFPSLLPLVVDTARELCHKYLERCPQRTVEEVLRGVSRAGEAVQRARGVRELVAAVVYCQHFPAIRLKIKQFARMNQLSLKIFNKKYVAYQNAARRQTPLPPAEVKLEEDSCKSEHCSQKEEEENETHQRLPVLQPVSVGSAKEAIELVFDGIFKSSYFQERRRETISKMADRCQEIGSQVFARMSWTASRPLRIFYAVYARLKQLGMSVGFTRYRQAVAAAAGFELKRAHALAAEKIMDQLMGEGESAMEEPSES